MKYRTDAAMMERTIGRKREDEGLVTSTMDNKNVKRGTGVRGHKGQQVTEEKRAEKSQSR